MKNAGSGITGCGNTYGVRCIVRGNHEGGIKIRMRGEDEARKMSKRVRCHRGRCAEQITTKAEREKE